MSSFGPRCGGREGVEGQGFVSGTAEAYLPKSQELLSPLAWVSYRKALHSRQLCLFCCLCLHAQHKAAMSYYMPEPRPKRGGGTMKRGRAMEGCCVMHATSVNSFCSIPICSVPSVDQLSQKQKHLVT